MKRLGRYRWGPQLLVELASFAVAFAVFAAVGGIYAAVMGDPMRPNWSLLLPAALVVGILLPLLRGPITVAVDRLAHGTRAEGYRMMSELMGRMSATLEVDEVLPRLAETAARSVHSERGEVSVWLADGRQWRRTWRPDLGGDAPDRAERAPGPDHAVVEPGVFAGPRDLAAGRHRALPMNGNSSTGAEKPAESDIFVEVQHQGDIVGELGVGVGGPYVSDADERVLNDLAGPAGVALATVRLTVELRRRVAEVAEQTGELQASRRRLVDARRVEQHRTWNRLDATVIPRISAISSALDEFRAAKKAGVRGDQHLEVAQSEATDALEALRAVARGIFPSVLADSGLEAALQSWADRRSPGRQVIVNGDLGPLHRYSAAEAALYYTCTLAIEETAGVMASAEIGSMPAEFKSHRPRPEPIFLATDGAVVTATIVLPTAPPVGAQRAIRDRLGALGGSLRIEAEAGAAPDPTTGPVVQVATIRLDEA
jgi:signal transduction histidine kinase